MLDEPFADFCLLDEAFAHLCSLDEPFAHLCSLDEPFAPLGLFDMPCADFTMANRVFCLPYHCQTRRLSILPLLAVLLAYFTDVNFAFCLFHQSVLCLLHISSFVQFD